MNEAVKHTHAETHAHQPAKKLTDAEVHAILASKPEGAFYSETDEVAEDKPTKH